MTPAEKKDLGLTLLGAAAGGVVGAVAGFALNRLVGGASEGPDPRVEALWSWHPIDLERLEDVEDRMASVESRLGHVADWREEHAARIARVEWALGQRAGSDPAALEARSAQLADFASRFDEARASGRRS